MFLCLYSICFFCLSAASSNKSAQGLHCHSDDSKLCSDITALCCNLEQDLQFDMPIYDKISSPLH